MKEKPFYLAFAFILSAMLHVGLIAHLSGVKWFHFPHLDTDRIVDVDLSQDKVLSKKAAKLPGKIRVAAKKEERAPSVVKTSPEIVSKSTEEWKADAAQSDLSVSGNDKPAPSKAGDEVKSISRAAENPVQSDRQKAKETGHPLMSAVSEKFLYDISWSGIHVGQAMLEASNENGEIKIASRVRSAAVISLFYKVEDFSESSIVNGAPAHFRIKQHEGKYRSDKATIFDGEDGKITFYNYLNNKMEEHAIKKNLPWDVLSGFYYLRTMPLAAGQTVYVDVFDSGKFLRVAVNVVRKEKIEVRSVGAVDTVMVRLLLTSEGLFKSQGDVNIWLTDDDRRIPVRVQTKIPLGSVTAELSSMERGS
jgi:Protein of unknown function (DUF3108)